MIDVYVFLAGRPRNTYNGDMEHDNKHTSRLALLLAFMVVMLVVISIDQFRAGTEDGEQQAAVLRVYGD
jgi:hypothetical protein